MEALFNHLAHGGRSAPRSIDSLPPKYDGYEVRCMQQWIEVFDKAFQDNDCRAAAEAALAMTVRYFWAS